jgi:hypothetical protein
MAKRKISAKTVRNDLSSWNFILFLTLAFILLVVVLTLMKNVSQDVRSKAGFECPTLQLPRPEDCPGGKWIYQRNTSGCLEMLCNQTTSAVTPSTP